MASFIQFEDWRFTSDLLSANHVETAVHIAFTRAERALLQIFVHNGGRVLSRERLLEAVSGIESEASDRSIDFTINRLRRKLQDSARRPRYIATQYGEGYLWVAQRVVTERASSGAFVVVGPVHGLHFSGRLAEIGWAFTEELTQVLDRNTAPRHRVTLELDCPPADQFEGEPPQFAVELSFLKAGDGRLDCAATLRRFASGVLVKVTRVSVSDARQEAQPEKIVAAARLATELIAEIWRSLNYTDQNTTAPGDEPLPVRLQHAALLLAKSQANWQAAEKQFRTSVRERPDNDKAASMFAHSQRLMDIGANQAAERRLRAALRDHPHDHETELMLATALHFKYIVCGYKMPEGPDRRRQDEAEIETLVLAALPHLQSNGIFMLTAAKLLYFVNKVHRPMAVELTETAFKTTTAFATAFTSMAQLYAWEGRIDEALTLYDQALELAPEANDFWLYLQVLKCSALTANGDHDSVAAIATRMYKSVPATRPQLGLFYAASDEFDLNPALKLILDGLDETGARWAIIYLHYVSARHFALKAHRQNILRRPLGLLVERFGEGWIADEIRPDMPDALLANTG